MQEIGNREPLLVSKRHAAETLSVSLSLTWAEFFSPTRRRLRVRASAVAFG